MKKITYKVGANLNLPDNDGNPTKAKVIGVYRTVPIDGLDEFVSMTANSPVFTEWSKRAVNQGDKHTLLNYEYSVTQKLRVRITTGAHIYRIFDENLGNITFFPKPNGTIELYRVEIYQQGRGLGSKVLQELNRISCETDISLSLELGNVGMLGKSQGDSNDNNRISFYEKNGFDKIKGTTKLTNKKLVDTYYE